MSELLLSPVSTLSSPPVAARANSGPASESKPNASNSSGPSSESKSNANSANPDVKDSAASANAPTGTESSSAPQDSQSTPTSFATVLKQRMGKAPDGKASNGMAPIDPLSLTGGTGASESKDEAPALEAFIEQLFPKLAKKSTAGEDEQTTAKGSSHSDDLATTLIAGPVTVAAEKAALDNKAASKEKGGGLESGMLKSDAADHRSSALSEDLAAKAAISADDAKSDAGLSRRSKMDSDFSSLLNHATEQLGASGQTGPANSSRAATAADSALRMDHPVGHADWSNELGNKLSWMATAQKQQADLVLNPPQLGRVEISLTVAGDQASAVFASPSAAVRELLEDSLPRLREILAGAGINLGEAQVGSESANRFGTQDQKGDNSSGRGILSPVGQDVPLNLASTSSARSVLAGRGMVDMFV